MDFWEALMLPALSGRHEHIFSIAERLRSRSPAAAHPRLDAITARALVTVGDAEAAVPLLDHALAAEDFEAEALARVLFPDGAQRCMEHLSDRPPGQAADAACDLVWHRHRHGDVRGAREAVQRGLTLCPDHIELQRWLQALLAFNAIDHLTLYPCRQQGWMSMARIRRRPDGHTVQIRPGALGRLQAAGVWGRRLASSTAYAALAAGAPCADIEAGIEMAWATLRCSRPVEPQLEMLWLQTIRHSGLDVLPVARAVVQVALQLHAPSKTGLAAAEVLSYAAPKEPRWRATLAHLLAAFGDQSALSEARAVLARPELDAVSWQLAHGAVVAMGHRREAQAAAELALHIPRLVQVAHRALCAD